MLRTSLIQLPIFELLINHLLVKKLRAHTSLLQGACQNARALPICVWYILHHRSFALTLAQGKRLHQGYIELTSVGRVECCYGLLRVCCYVRTCEISELRIQARSCFLALGKIIAWIRAAWWKWMDRGLVKAPWPRNSKKVFQIAPPQNPSSL